MEDYYERYLYNVSNFSDCLTNYNVTCSNNTYGYCNGIY